MTESLIHTKFYYQFTIYDKKISLFLLKTCSCRCSWRRQREPSAGWWRSNNISSGPWGPHRRAPRRRSAPQSPLRPAASWPAICDAGAAAGRTCVRKKGVEKCVGLRQRNNLLLVGGERVGGERRQGAGGRRKIDRPVVGRQNLNVHVHVALVLRLRNTPEIEWVVSQAEG